MMNKLLAIALSVCLGALLQRTAFAYEDGDWQFWCSGSIERTIGESWKVRLEQQFRLGDKMGELYYHYTDLGATWKLTTCLNLGLNYAQLCQKMQGMWKEENRPNINGALIWKWHGFKFEDRNRLERRNCEGAENIWMYRNKLSFLPPSKRTKLDVQPYFADVIFANLDESELFRNRVYGDLNSQLAQYLKVDIFYLWQSSEKGENWFDYHVIGAKLKASI